MFICLDCGEIFEEPRKVRESRGEFWGAPCYEEWWGCPHCSGAYEEYSEEYEYEEDDEIEC